MMAGKLREQGTATGNAAIGSPQTLPRRYVEKIQLLSGKILQENRLLSRRFADPIRITVRRHHHVLTFRHLPQLVTRNDLIAIERQPKLGFAWNQKHSDRQAMKLPSVISVS